MRKVNRLMGPDDLIMSALTVTTSDFRARVEAAAAAGYAGIGMRPSFYRQARREGATDVQLRAILDEHDVEVAELEVLSGWAQGGEIGAKSRAYEDRLFEIADTLGGRHMIANSELEGPLEVTAERFYALCDRAAAHGLLVGIEFLPWTSLPDIATAWDIVRTADHPNGGILVDTWHHYRGAADDDELRAVPGEKVVAVHFNDADAEPIGDLLDDTLHRRRLPGQGAFPLVDFVRNLDGMGVRVPFSVEVISDELAALPPSESARLTAEATRSVLAQARG